MTDRIEMDGPRWERTLEYVRAVFCAGDAARHDALMERAVAAGLPPIDVGPESGRLLQLLVRVSGGRRVVEIGTLAGSSAIWMAGGLVQDGRIITVDADAHHAEIARSEFARAGVADRIEARVGRGGEALPALLQELGPGTVDLILLDAERSEYSALVPAVGALLRPGGLLVVDNALSARRWTADPVQPGEDPDTMDLLNRQVAADSAFLSTLVPVGNGLLLAVRRN